jgi:predicted lipid carrier protein YhbT
MGMERPIRSTAPLSPVLLLGMAIRPLPLSPLQPMLDIAVKRMLWQHPEVFARLADVGYPVFLIDPVDLPFVFLLRPDPNRPILKAAGSGGEEEVSAVIRGPLLSLMDLLEGRMDGDSLFFSRELVIEGDTEAVVALRNAVDGAEIDIVADVLSPLGPLAGLGRYLVLGAAAVFARAAEDLETVRAAMIAPAIRRSDALAAELRDLGEQLDTLRRQVQRRRVKRP